MTGVDVWVDVGDEVGDAELVETAVAVAVNV